MASLFSFVFVFGVLVFVHELGHFAAAKWVGIRVLKFQLGFNPVIVRFRRGDTEYCIGALPFGGFVKMAGEDLGEQQPGDASTLSSKSKWKRLQVLVMGPVMNLLLAVVLTALVLHAGRDVPAYQYQTATVGRVLAGSPAASAGIRAGDVAVRVSDRAVATWQDVDVAVAAQPPDRDVVLVLRRNEGELTLRLGPAGSTPRGNWLRPLGLFPVTRPQLVAVNAGGSADRAGLRTGDTVVALDSRPIVSDVTFRETIAAHPGQPLTLTVLRSGQRSDIVVVPSAEGRIGVTTMEETSVHKLALAASVEASVRENARDAAEIFETLWGIATRKVSPRQIMGPIGIAQLSVQSAQLGWLPLLSLMAMLSLNLGIVNLLPIPVLDGGYIAIMALEGLARRDFSIRVKQRMMMAGLAALVMLMSTALYNDLLRISWVERLIPWR